MKNNFKSYAFCFGVCAAIIGVVVAIGNAFNFKVDEVALTSIITAILGVLVAMGIIQKEENSGESKDITYEGEDVNLLEEETFLNKNEDERENKSAFTSDETKDTDKK